MTLSSILSTALLALVGAAACMDLRSRRIPNLLTASGLCTALVLHGFGGAAAVAGGLLGAALALLLALPLFAAGGMGGGDTKLLVAVGGFLGPQRLMVAVLVAALAGGVMALGLAWRRRTLLPVLLRTVELARHHATLGRAGPRPTLAPDDPTASLPYAVPIAVGVLVGWFL